MALYDVIVLIDLLLRENDNVGRGFWSIGDHVRSEGSAVAQVVEVVAELLLRTEVLSVDGAVEVVDAREGKVQADGLREGADLLASVARLAALREASCTSEASGTGADTVVCAGRATIVVAAAADAVRRLGLIVVVGASEADVDAADVDTAEAISNSDADATGATDVDSDATELALFEAGVGDDRSGRPGGRVVLCPANALNTGKLGLAGLALLHSTVASKLALVHARVEGLPLGNDGVVWGGASRSDECAKRKEERDDEDLGVLHCGDYDCGR